MRYSRLKNSLKKKMLAGFVMGFAAFSMLQPLVAKAEENTKTQNEVKITEEKYTLVDRENMFGIAADFGIFANTMNGASDIETNVACKVLNFGGHTLTSHFTNAVCYADQVTSPGNLNGSTLYVKDGKITNTNNVTDWAVDGYSVGGSITEIVKASNFIDIDTEMNKLLSLSEELMTYTQQNTDISFTDMNNQYIQCNSNFNVIKIAAAPLSDQDKPVSINNINGDKLLVINVDTSNYGDVFMLPKIRIDGSEAFYSNDKYKTTTSNFIWNFGDYNGTIINRGESSGIILAPKATVQLGATHIGAVMANVFTNPGGELHYVPYNHLKVSVVSVDGNCCPSTPLAGTEFAVYKKSGATWRKVNGSTTVVSLNSEGKYVATWTLSEEGQYYIKEVNTVAGFTRTPIKARFDIVNESGMKKLKMIQGKEAVGYCATIRDGKFLIRHYSNEVLVAAFSDLSSKPLKNTSFEVYEATNGIAGDLGYTGTPIASGNADSAGVFVANIKKTGYYCVVQTETQKGYKIPVSTKKIAVFTTQIGQLLSVELDTATGEGILDIILNNIVAKTSSPMEMTKFTSKLNRALIAYGFNNNEPKLEYTLATDTCVEFVNEKN